MAPRSCFSIDVPLLGEFRSFVRLPSLPHGVGAREDRWGEFELAGLFEGFRPRRVDWRVRLGAWQVVFNRASHARQTTARHAEAPPLVVRPARPLDAHQGL